MMNTDWYQGLDYDDPDPARLIRAIGLISSNLEMLDRVDGIVARHSALRRLLLENAIYYTPSITMSITHQITNYCYHRKTPI